MQAIRKAIIPVAGFGTRLLPMSKAIPKEMVPVVDRPLIGSSSPHVGLPLPMLISDNT